MSIEAGEEEAAEAVAAEESQSQKRIKHNKNAGKGHQPEEKRPCVRECDWPVFLCEFLYKRVCESRNLAANYHYDHL